MENPIKMDDLGVPLFLETPLIYVWMTLRSFFKSIDPFVLRIRRRRWRCWCNGACSALAEWRNIWDEKWRDLVFVNLTGGFNACVCI